MGSPSEHSTEARQHAHELIDKLPLYQVQAMVGLIEAILTTGHVLTNVPYEDEVCSEEENLAAEASKAWLKHNQPIRNEDALAAFGLSPAEFDLMGRPQLTQTREGQ